MVKDLTVKMPLRIDVMGGSLDLSPIKESLIIQGYRPMTLVFNIEKYVGCHLHENPTPTVVLTHRNTQEQTTLDDKNCPSSLVFLKSWIQYAIPHLTHCKWEIFSEVETGSGLGASSALLVSLIQASQEWQGKHPLTLIDLVWTAHGFETGFLKSVCGLQDYLAPLIQKPAYLEWTLGGWKIHPLSINVARLKTHIVQLFTGLPHISAQTNQNLLDRFVHKPEQIMSLLIQMTQVIKEFKHQLTQNPNLSWASYWEADWEIRDNLNVGFVNSDMIELKKEMQSAGCQGIKICGAGGGGTVLGWVDNPTQQEKVCSLLQKYHAQPCLLLHS